MTRRHLFAACLVAMVQIAVATAAAPAGELRVGAAQVVITPPDGTPMAGYYSERLAAGVHDDLYAKAIVIEQDGSRVALVACDLIAMPRPIVERVRAQLTDVSDFTLDPSRLMLSATHSHTGPLLLSGSSRDPALGGSDEATRKYNQTLPGRIIESIRLASRAMKPARVSVGVGREERLAFNRRFVMKDGTVGWNPGKLNPQIVKPVGPTDPDVPVIRFDALDDGKPIATYVNFSMHLDTVGGARISADYPHTLASILARVHGNDGAVTLFTIGAAGDINHIDVSTDRKQSGPEEARRIGTILASEVIKTSTRLEPITPAPPRAASSTVPLDLAPIKPGELEAARKTAVTFGKDAPSFLERVHAFKVLDVAAREGKPLDAQVQVIALGDDLAWVALPGEVFVELGIEIRRRSPFKHTIIATLANGTIGYIPTSRAYDEGNYEPISARCAKGSGERLVEEALRLLDEVKHARERAAVDPRDKAP